ncbi:MAG TPA: hypothetical protein VM344_06680 [Vitreimonas sp.]|nr:hypothetical protein [Vitreimonas sp.]
MRPLGLLLIALGLVAFALSSVAATGTLDVVFVAIGLVLVLAGVGLLVFGWPGGRRDGARGMTRGADVVPPVASPPPGAGPTDTGDRNLSSPVPIGPSSEPAATAGTGRSAPAPVVPSEDRPPAPSTASASYEPAPTADPLDDGPGPPR